MQCIHCGAEMPAETNKCPSCGVASYTAPVNKNKDPMARLIPFCAILIVVCSMLLLLLNPALARMENTGGQTVSEDCFRLVDGELYFVPEKYIGGRVLTVPDTIDGQPVTAIGDNGFYDCDGLTTILLPEGITRIGESAFAGCDDLRGMLVPEQVRHIGSNAFRGCTALEAVYISGTISSIGENAFDGCVSLFYIFYDGAFDAWYELYYEYINPFTTAICVDGYYYHGAN